jgi:hypothetical protein
MKNIHALMQELVALTTQIETNYPEVYKTLNETPLFLGDSRSEGVTTKELESYLNTLKEELKKYIVNHPKESFKE